MKFNLRFQNRETEECLCGSVPGTIAASGHVNDGQVPGSLDSLQWTGAAMKQAVGLQPVSLPEIEFGLAAADVPWREVTLRVKSKDVSVSDIAGVLGGAGNIPQAVRDSVLAVLNPLVKNAIAEFVEKADIGGFFIGPFHACANLILSDGTSVTLPIPKLMVPNDRVAEAVVTGVRASGEETLVTCAFACRPTTLCVRLRSRGGGFPGIARYEILATRPASLYSKESAVQFVGNAGRSVTESGDLNGIHLINISSSKLSIVNGVPGRGWTTDSIQSPLSSALVRSENQWHKLISLAPEELVLNEWKRIVLPGPLSSRFGTKGLNPDFSALTVPVSGLMTNVSDRTVMLRPQLILPDPAPPRGCLPVGYDSGGNAAGVRLKSVYVTMEDGITLSSFPDGLVVFDPDDGSLHEWIYPSKGARRIVIETERADGISSAYEFPTSDDIESCASVSNGSIRALDAAELPGLRKSAIPFSMYIRSHDNLMLDWKNSLPPLCSLSHRLEIENSRLCAAVRTPSTSGNDLYPQLRLISDDGVRLLRWSASGGWKLSSYISSEGCDDSDSVLECGEKTVYRSPSGLRVIVNNSVRSFGDIEDEDERHGFITELPRIEEITGSFPDTSCMSLLIMSGEMSYCKEKNLLRIAKDGRKLYFDMSTLSRTEPEATAASGLRWFVTAPIEPGAPRIKAIEFSGCSLKSGLRVFIYTSDTLADWRLVSAGEAQHFRVGPFCGGRGRYFVLALSANFNSARPCLGVRIKT